MKFISTKMFVFGVILFISIPKTGKCANYTHQEMMIINWGINSDQIKIKPPIYTDTAGTQGQDLPGKKPM